MQDPTPSASLRAQAQIYPDEASSDLRRRVPATGITDLQLDESEKVKVHKNGTDIESIIAPILFTLLSIFTRMYKIGKSDIVTWDEAHFGKFGSYYLKHEFYFDVHPPLGKMLVGLSGWLCGYNGSFDFESGKKYPEEVNYVFMRIFNAAFGVLCTPIAYYTAKSLGLSKKATWLVTILVTFENSYATISRFILLDSMLMFFTFTTFFALVKFQQYQNKPFSRKWWMWLAALGFNIGCVCSVKWVGMFVTATVGLYTIHELWDKFGDLNMKYTTYAKHWLARIYCLMVIPFIVYAICFKIHFAILTRSGPGDAQMTSLFQANLDGSSITVGPEFMAMGSRFTLKNSGYGGGLLHSHVQTYPSGSEQQQVTCYHHQDSNNYWEFRVVREDQPFDYDQGDIEYIRDGSVVRLLHTNTGRNLHSHMVQAPVTHKHRVWEVAGYGNDTIGDAKDYWVVEIEQGPSNRDGLLTALTSTFRLRNRELNCYLRAANVNLPQWGFKQIEVTCDSDKKDGHTLWNVETNINDHLPQADRKSQKSPFWRDFMHLNVAMMTTNNALVPDPDKFDVLASKPWEWPIAHVGLRMCGWEDDRVKYFLLPNPAVVYPTTLAIILIGLLTIFYILRYQRSIKDLNINELNFYIRGGIYPLIGWAFHYLTFFLMGRVTYVHHYLPAMYFAILVYGFLIDFITRKYCNKFFTILLFGFLYSIIIGLFFYFSPITFGMTGPHTNYSYLNWIKTWWI